MGRIFWSDIFRSANFGSAILCGRKWQTRSWQTWKCQTKSKE